MVANDASSSAIEYSLHCQEMKARMNSKFQLQVWNSSLAGGLIVVLSRDDAFVYPGTLNKHHRSERQGVLHMHLINLYCNHFYDVCAPLRRLQ